MRSTFTLAAAAAAAALAATVIATPASAACQRVGFTVNDYGKDGPTKDAKELLDKLIAKKMAERGVTKFTTGKKEVKCELFLNFIVFDEHTCTAEATVCWDGAPLPKGEAVTEETATKPAATKTSATKTAPEKKTAATPVEKPAGNSAEKPAAAKETAKPAATETAKVVEPVTAAEPAKATGKPAWSEPAKPAAQ